jgi:hypothetical protein
MSIPLERLIEGLITTMRTDVIPGVPDGYAKGQAIGIVDILNGMRGRVEWTREPALESVQAKLALLEKLRMLLPDLTGVPAAAQPETLSSVELFAERDRLDALIGDALKAAFATGEGKGPEEALALIKAHMHDEAAREMKLTRKPLFAEIASGGSKPT